MLRNIKLTPINITCNEHASFGDRVPDALTQTMALLSMMDDVPCQYQKAFVCI